MMARPRSRTAAGGIRRTRPVRRASARLTHVRAGAALTMLLSAGAIYGAGASPAFDVSRIAVSELRYTDRGTIVSRLAVPDDANAFTLATEPLELRLRQLPTVAQASVGVRLPGTLAVEVAEREPILVWQVGERGLLADREGVLFAELGPGGERRPAGLPVVADERESSAGYAVGTRLDPVDLDAATRLAALRPADVGSAGPHLALAVTDASGFVLAGAAGWRAVFGFYTPSLRTPGIIPGQVRLLRSLLVEQGERNVARVILAAEDEGVFTTPTPSSRPSP